MGAEHRVPWFGTLVPWCGTPGPMVRNTVPMVRSTWSHGAEHLVPWCGTPGPMVRNTVPMVRNTWSHRAEHCSRWRGTRGPMVRKTVPDGAEHMDPWCGTLFLLCGTLGSMLRNTVPMVRNTWSHGEEHLIPWSGTYGHTVRNARSHRVEHRSHGSGHASLHSVSAVPPRIRPSSGRSTQGQAFVFVLDASI